MHIHVCFCIRIDLSHFTGSQLFIIAASVWFVSWEKSGDMYEPSVYIVEGSPDIEQLLLVRFIRKLHHITLSMYMHNHFKFDPRKNNTVMNISLGNLQL